MESGKLEKKKSFEVTAAKSCMCSCLHACCSHNWLFNHLYVSLSIRSFILSVRWPSKKIATKMPSRLVPMIATNISVPVPPLSHCPFARTYTCERVSGFPSSFHSNCVCCGSMKETTKFIWLPIFSFAYLIVGLI